VPVVQHRAVRSATAQRRPPAVGLRRILQGPGGVRRGRTASPVPEGGRVADDAEPVMGVNTAAGPVSMGGFGVRRRPAAGRLPPGRQQLNISARIWTFLSGYGV